MYTRKGDKGETSLYGPKRVRKDSPRVEAYGAIDELNSVVGVVASGSKDPKVVGSLREVQRMLFVAGGDSASELSEKKVPRIGPGDVARIEEMTDELLSGLPPLKNFILPGGTQTGAMIQLARAVCRRAERRMVTASRTGEMNPELLPFLNRLSSFLFNLSRHVNAKGGKKEEVWKS